MSEEKKETKPKQKILDNIIFIGKKPFMNYIHSAQIIFRNNNIVEICARGKSISRAVDIAEVLEKRLMKDQIEKVEITTNSESFDSREGNGKKRVFIPEKTKEILVKDVKVRVNSSKNKVKNEKNNQDIG